MEHSASAFDSYSGGNVSAAVFAVESVKNVKVLTAIPFDIAFIAPNRHIVKNEDNSFSITPGVYSFQVQGRVDAGSKFRMRFKVSPSSEESKMINTFSFNEYDSVNINATSIVFAETNSIVNLIFIGSRRDMIKVYPGFRLSITKL